MKASTQGKLAHFFKTLAHGEKSVDILRDNLSD